MERIAIIGTGLIGRAWAMVFARAGHTVKLYDSTPGAADKAIGLIREGLEELQQFGLIKESPDTVMKRVSGAATLAEAVRDADYVQENTSERLDVKREVYRQLDEAAPAHCTRKSARSPSPLRKRSRASFSTAFRPRCCWNHGAW